MKPKNLFLLLGVGIVLVIFCYLFVDRYIVWFFHDLNSRDYSIFKFFSDDINSFITKIIALFYIYYLLKLITKKQTDFDYKLLLISNSVLIGQAVKEFLKGIFCRYWPDTFINNNLSLVKDGVYGFNWFHPNATNASFPSGHATFIFSFSIAAYILFPRLKGVWLGLAFLVVLGQLVMYFHFASDLIAGSILGSIVACYTASFYKQKK